ncbi:MAG: hypothetical protein D6725_15975 [Planctomycetota bacterium]|nr:MAG: hypothetical protein D6725_15975 [Planctomycetota bacterium]
MRTDGELDDRARRQPFCRLDAEREGWKRCALAFSDEQCLRRELRGAHARSATAGRSCRRLGRANGTRLTLQKPPSGKRSSSRC